MGISYIPGPEATLGPALAQIATAIGDIAKPNARFQKAFQQALVQQPQILQQLADLEGRTPGIISKEFAPLIGEDLAAVISRMIPSLRVQQENIISENLPTVANVPTEMLPDVARTPGAIAATRELTGARPNELVVEGEQAAQANIAGVQRAAAQAWWNRQSDEDKVKMVGPYGTLDDVIATPSFLQRLALDWSITKSRRADDIYNYMQQKEIANATWWQQTTRTGTIDDWLYYFSDKGRKRMQAIAQGATPTADDARLMAIGAAYDEENAIKDAAAQMRRTQIVNVAVDNINQTIPRIRSARGSERVALIASLNQTLTQVGSEYTAQWTDAKTKGGPSRMLHGERLRFFDRAGNEVNSNAVIDGLLSSVPAARTGGNQADFARAAERARHWQAEGQRQGLRDAALANFIKSKLRSEGINVQ